MSYSRFGELSDVYLFPDVQGGLTCCACRIASNQHDAWGHFLDLDDALAHIQAHRDAGHTCGRDWDDLVRDVRDEWEATDGC